MRRLAPYFFIPLLATTLAGCASTSAVSTLTPHVKPNNDATWLIFAEAVEPSHQILFEKQCVNAWQKAGLHASAAHQVLPQTQGDNSELIAHAQAAGFDQLIIIDSTSTQLQAPQFSHSLPTISATRDQRGTHVQNYRELAEQPTVGQRTVADIYPLQHTGKATRIQVDSNEANNIKRISRSQCKALATYLVN